MQDLLPVEVSHSGSNLFTSAYPGNRLKGCLKLAIHCQKLYDDRGFPKNTIPDCPESYREE